MSRSTVSAIFFFSALTSGNTFTTSKSPQQNARSAYFSILNTRGGGDISNPIVTNKSSANLNNSTSIQGGFSSSSIPTSSISKSTNVETSAEISTSGNVVGGNIEMQNQVQQRTQLSATINGSESMEKIESGDISDTEEQEETVVNTSKRPMKVLFLSSDTGGGHRASAESLAKQFERHYPGSTYDLLDVWTKDGCWPYRTLVPTYKHLSANPRQWGFLYHFSNTSPYLACTDIHSMATCEKKIRKTIETYQPDVVVSVHPTMQNVPLKATRNLGKKYGKYIPFFTVITDFGSAHCHWYHKKVDKTYIASDKIRKLARRRGRVPEDRLVQIGLPIRMDFATQADNMGGNRNSEKGKDYRMKIRDQLGISKEKKMVLVMGGGEGVGSLSEIVDSLYATFSREGVDATVAVVCGRNEKLLKELQTKDWSTVQLNQGRVKKRHFLYRFIGRASPSRRIRRALEKRIERVRAGKVNPEEHKGKVDVLGLGFVTNMAEYMVAADLLITKAGPGTIAEAAAVGLPCMITR